MSLASAPDRLRLPDTLRAQLLAFRRRVWTIKLVEAIAAAVLGISIAQLALFGLDRLFETPGWARLGLFCVVAVAAANIPRALHRWVYRNRKLEQLARLLAKKLPAVGDQLLGIIELEHNEFEQARSPQLVQAAIENVAQDARGRDFRSAVPNPRHVGFTIAAAIPAAVAALLLVVYPAAATNTWQRLLMPWLPTPRYTFASLETVPDRLVVPHGEAFDVALKLRPESEWHPNKAVAQLGAQTPVAAALGTENGYKLEFPPQLDSAPLEIKVGDARIHSRVEPTLRPELLHASAVVQLPAYLRRTEPLKKDVRGGAVTVVKGGKATFTATVSRDLAKASVDGQERQPEGAKVTSPATSIDASRSVVFAWQDVLGLESAAPFTLAVTARDDESPSIAVEDMPRQKVLLDIEALAFKIRASDDFGVKQIGIEWQGVEDPTVKTPAKGERIFYAGGPTQDSVQCPGSFTAKTLGIEPQAVEVRLFAEDYFPGRPRVYSPVYTFYVLNAEQHAIWLTEQLSKWHRQSLEVRDRELKLYETNKQIRALASSELDKPEVRRKIENQAAAELANGRRLSSLVVSGEDLVKQAMRNPEFAIASLEKWAEMLQILKDIAGNRMPSVADMLKEAAAAPRLAQAQKGGKTALAGQVKSNPAGSGSKATPPATKPLPNAPQLADAESSQQPPDEKASTKPGAPSKPKAPRLGFPVTTLPGKPSESQPPPETPAEQKVDEAINRQRDLLAEFEKIADELNRVLANLEGSTLVKRLKAEARKQTKVGGRIADVITRTFGALATNDAPTGKLLGELAEQEARASQSVSYIMDDMASFFERRRLMKLKTVLDEMREQDVVGGLRQLGDDVKKENGVSMSLCEYWSDTLDRWAEDLVDAAGSGTCKAKSRSSLPPSYVLEAMLILEGEINLREDTRITQQARAATETKAYEKRASELSTTQKTLDERVLTLQQKIRELEDGEKEFGYEIALLGKISEAMGDATEILARPDTGPPAIAAETEAIELFLQSKRINPRGGGGGGPNPGGGGHGSTVDSALALLGSGVNEKEVREDHGISQATGESGAGLPEEYRAGLDEYFNRLDRSAGGTR